MRGRGVPGEPRLRGVQRPAPPRRVRALDPGPRIGGPVRRVRRQARRAGRMGGVGDQPRRRRHAGRAGARRGAVRRSRRRVVRPNLQHLRVRARGARAYRVPGVGPRRGAQRRWPGQGLRDSQFGSRRRGAEPGVAGRCRRLRREPRAARHGRRQPRRQGQAGPAECHHRLRRCRQRHQEAQYPWNPERRELGHSAANGRHLRAIPQDIQLCRPRMVLPPRHLPATRLRRRRLRLGHRHQPGQRVRGRHLHDSPEHRHRGLRSRHPSSLGAVPEAQQGAQVPCVLEHVPPLRRVRRHRPRHRQHLQGHGHPRRRAAVADGLRRSRLLPGRRGRGPGGRHVERGRQEAQGGEQDLQQRLQWLPAALRVKRTFRSCSCVACIYLRSCLVLCNNRIGTV